VENIQLPNKIFLHNNDYQVRIVIDDWRIATTHQHI
jgi:hypothetical protein